MLPRMLLGRALSGLTLTLICGACSSRPLDPPPGTDLGTTQPTPDAGLPNPSQTLTVFDGARISSDSKAPNFQVISSDVDFSGGPFTSVTLSADLGTTCVPFSAWADHPPPSGQHWPADCDAFDRNFEISLDGPDANDSDAGPVAPGLELVRAITPFGGPLHLEHDLTNVANALSGVHRLRVRINTWPDPAGLVSGSAGGWNVSLALTRVMGAPALHVSQVTPLVYGDLKSTDSDSFAFVTPGGTAHAYVEYRTTGHGAAAGSLFDCSGPAEEFCRRQQQVLLDGAVISSFTPWRDCASACTLSHDASRNVDYCAENPCGDVASVKAARANWCPGSESPARLIDDPQLAVAGPHQLSLHVSDIADGGSLRISATFFAFAP